MAQARRSPSLKLPEGQRPNAISSSPISIPKKPLRAHASTTPTSASSASFGESTSVPSGGEIDDTLVVLPSMGQELKHNAARDRISVRNARRQPLKQKLNTLRETDDQETTDTVVSEPVKNEETNIPTRPEVKPAQPLIDLGDIHSARARLRMSVRTRDRSADNLLLAINHTDKNESSSTETPFIPSKLPSALQRSVSFKRPQEMAEKSPLNRPLILRTNVADEPAAVPSPSSSSSSQEHIYDNLDVFQKDASEVKTRENQGKASIRLRPVTMHVPSTSSDSSSSSTNNEFEQILNQLKKRGSIRRVRIQEEVPAVIPTEPETKAVEPVPSPPPAPRRKTLVSVHLSGTDKVASDETKPVPSWIDIAKQKQTKFQSGTTDEKTPLDQNEETTVKSPVIIRKTAPSSETRMNRKSMFDSSNTNSNSHAIERDSIRALKAGNSSRINNLIQFFDK